jgi:hypothetical protein
MVKNNMIGFIEGQLPLNLKSAMDEHLIQCKSCANILGNVKATYTIYGLSDIPPLNPFFYTKLEQKLKLKTRNKTYIFNFINGPWQSIAASILIVSGIFIGIYVGKHLEIQEKSTNSINENDVLNIYATEYYIENTDFENNYNMLINK